jgi:hypothetical protein
MVLAIGGSIIGFVTHIRYKLACIETFQSDRYIYEILKVDKRAEMYIATGGKQLVAANNGI